MEEATTYLDKVTNMAIEYAPSLLLAIVMLEDEIFFFDLMFSLHFFVWRGVVCIGVHACLE